MNFSLPIQVSRMANGKRKTTSSTSETAQVSSLKSIIKAPLDTKNYKAIQLKNGIKAVLVSTCLHQSDDKKSVSDKISEFNKATLSIDSYDIPAGETGSKKPANFVQNLWNMITPAQVESTQTKFEEFSLNTGECGEPSKKQARLIRCCDDFATVCVTVGSGSFHDPCDINGMAHLVEHLIFLGSENHPEANKLFVHVYDNGGLVNAFTQGEYTCFYFTVKVTGLETSLDILADALNQPLFEDKAVWKEVEAIDSEYAIKQTCDATRAFDFLRFLATSAHPMGKFYWGDKKSLSCVDLPVRVKKWKEGHYTPDKMTVCIQGPMAVEKLQEMFVRHFSVIPPAEGNHEREKMEAPYQGTINKFPTLYHLTPITDMNWLIISWCLPAQLWKDYNTKPLGYLKYILNYPGPSGLVFYLKNKDLITRFWSSCSNTDNFFRNECCSFYCIQMVLTEKGYKERKLVLRSVFSYIRYILDSGISERYYNEMKRSSLNTFHFQNWNEMLKSSTQISVGLQQVPSEDVLISPWLFREYSESKLREYFNLFTPRAANYLILNKADSGDCTQEAWTGKIRYKEKPLSEEEYRELENVQPYPEFDLLPENVFLSYQIKVEENPCEELSPDDVAHASDKLLINYVEEKKNPCLSPRVASASYNLLILSPLVTQLPDKQPFLEVWTRLAQTKVITLIQYHFDKLYEHSLSVYDDSIGVTVSGPRQHLTQLLKVILCCLLHQEDHEKETFNSIKNELLLEYRNDTMDNYTLTEDMQAYLIRSNHINCFHLADVLNGISHEDFIAGLAQFKRRMSIEVELSGTILGEDKKEIIQMFESLKYDEFKSINGSIERATVLPLGVSKLNLRATHPAYVTSVISNHYQFGAENNDKLRYVSLIYYAMRRRLTHQLRTIEQLGYTVRLSFVRDLNSLGLSITVLTQPQKFETAKIDERVNNFLQCFYKFYFCSAQRMNDLFGRYTRAPINLQEFRDFYQAYLLPEGEHYRKVTIQVTGTKPQKSTSSVQENPFKLEYVNRQENGVHSISNIALFKHQLDLFTIS